MKDVIIKILEEYEYDLTHFLFSDSTDLRKKYDGEIDNLLKQIAEKINEKIPN